MLAFHFALVFLIGCSVGSFLNVCAYRLPYERSIFWPGSHCGHCFQPIRWYDNVPLLSYWLLHGRCRRCGAHFSPRYFVVELGTGLAFVGLFYLEVVRNVLGVPLLARAQAEIGLGLVPAGGWVLFGYHAILFCFLLVGSLCDLEHMEIPLGLTVTGTVVGLVGACLLSWPYPEPAAAVPAAPQPIQVPGMQPFPVFGQPRLPIGVQPWPVWFPLPDWLPAGGWLLGLANGLAGAAVGMLVLRGVRFLFGLGRGIEGLGVGDADLMMMAGSFVGWQPVLMAFFVGVFPALVFGVVQVLRRGGQAMPFGPSLAVGVLISLLYWPSIGGHFQPLLFNAGWMGTLAGAGAFSILAAAFVLRLLRGTGPAEGTPPAETPAPG